MRIAPVARRQWGTVATRQLLALGIGPMEIKRLVARGFLIRLHPSVYAVGFRPRTIEARMQVALLLGGDRAGLSHEAAAFCLGFTDRLPTMIEVRCPGAPVARPGIRFHRSGHFAQVQARDFPVTAPALTLVDLAARVSPRALRRAIAAADRQGMLELRAIDEALRRGRAGSARLRLALQAYTPELASTLSELEDRFIELLATSGLPIPQVNVTIGGMMVDALFVDQRLVVELDGHRFHSHPAASEVDRGRELRLRALGYRVVRYTWQQVTRTPGEVVADLRRELGDR